MSGRGGASDRGSEVLKQVAGSSIVTPFMGAGIILDSQLAHHLKHGTVIDYVQPSCGATGVR